MYGLKETVDLSFLMEKDLVQVCLGSHQVTLNFDDDLNISIECNFYLNSGDKEIIKASSDDTEKTKELAVLLGTEIKRIENNGDGKLALFFSNNYSLDIAR